MLSTVLDFNIFCRLLSEVKAEIMLSSALAKAIGSLICLVELSAFVSCLPEVGSYEASRLPFHIHARAENKDGSTPLYKNPNADIEDRVNDLLPRMTLQEKVAQM